MKLTTLSDNTLLLEQHMSDSRNILRESCDGLTLEQRRIVEGIYRELTPLIEASLTADQIKGIFGALEKQSIEGGKNRTLIGKGADTAKKANEIIGNVGKWLQDTTPVKMADQKFEQLKAKVGSKFPELDKQLTGLGTWMKENPGKSAAIIGVLTALASLAGGPVGGAIAGQVLRGSAELIKGEKLSTAVGKGIKTAVLGYLTGALANKVGEWLSGLRADVVPFDDGLKQVSFTGNSTVRAPGFEWTRNIDMKNITVMPSDDQYLDYLVKAVNSGQPGAFDKLWKFAKEVSSDDYKALLGGVSDAAKQAALDNDAAFQALEAARKGITAAAQGAVAASGEGGKKEKKESYYVQTRPLSEGQVYRLFNLIEQKEIVAEGPLGSIAKNIGGKLASAGKAVGGAVAGAAGAVAKQATEKVTAGKLMLAWKAEGSPTDSEELKKFLLNYGGIDAGTVDKVYADMKISSAPAQQPEPAADAAAAAAKDPTLYKQTSELLAKMNKKEKQRMAAYLEKAIAAAPSRAPAAKAAPGAKAPAAKPAAPAA